MFKGVPEITHVKLSIESPKGRAGETVQLVIGLPLGLRAVGFTVIILPTMPVVPVAPMKLTLGTATFVTCKETVATAFGLMPLDKVTVKVVGERRAVGVPEITQFEVLIVTPVGSAGNIVQLCAGAPLVLKVVGATVIRLLIAPFVPKDPL